MSSPIEDYAMIGDCHTAALVARDGSIDWLCWPRFDSGACFAALLGSPDNGRWRIAPSGRVIATHRRYRDGTLVLETDFETDTGTVTVIDFMPVREAVSDLIRLVIGRTGEVAMDLELVLRFDYGASVPWVTRSHDGGLVAVAGPDLVILRTPIALHGEGLRTRARFVVRAGSTIPFVLSYGPSWRSAPTPIDPMRSLEETEKGWRRWSDRCDLGGPWRESVKRSLVTLKALTYVPTGGIVAAATTSLPEQPGGVRNWDYRFCWLRDATLTLLALMNANYYDEARAWRSWLHRAVAGSPDQIQVMYGLAGERRLDERTLPWLKGYEGAQPVRIGNAAAAQIQLDVYGEVMDALYQARRGGLAESDDAWPFQLELMKHLESQWSEPDEGIWEVRGGPQHFTYSKLMAWVAFDRAVRSIEEFGVKGPHARWTQIRRRIHTEVCEQGFNARRNSFVQVYGSDELDASLLLLPGTGFLPARDPRVLGTIDAIARELTDDGLVLRYRTETTKDGLPPGEGRFLACSFWLVDALVQAGRRPEAEERFEKLLQLQNDVGLLAEEYDPAARRMLGNFPQAFSHVALVNSALNLARTATGEAHTTAANGASPRAPTTANPA